MPQNPRRLKTVPFSTVELGGVAYAILPAAALLAICRRAGMAAMPRGTAALSSLDVAAPEQLHGPGLAGRLAARRRLAGLTQGQLARRAGVRIETVNRIERGHVNPDFATIRKLVAAMLAAESASAKPPVARRKE